VRAVVDTTVFAPLDGLERALARLAEITESHVVAYDLRVTGQGLPLCAAIAQAHLERGQLAAVHRVERELPPWIVLVAYARPTELRNPVQALTQAAAALQP
jgi:hypothetical protein